MSATNSTGGPEERRPGKKDEELCEEQFFTGRVTSDLVLPLDQVAEGYRAMDERRAIKALLRPWSQQRG
jgi:hypothetical protein